MVLIILPILNIFTSCFLRKILSYRHGLLFLVHSSLLFLIFAFYLFFNVCCLKSSYYYNSGIWISCNNLVLTWSFSFDPLSVLFLLMVSVVSVVVQIYSICYMRAEPYLFLFIIYLNFFTFCMFILVSASEFGLMFLGWEGIGVASYLLISFWSSRVQAIKSSLKAFVLNRIGDIGVFVAMAMIYFCFCSFEFSVIFSLVFYFISVVSFLKVNYLKYICLFLFLGVSGKSAQLGLQTWLPDAMEGPTPVSALIHAATLVTAGVYLIVRCCYLFEVTAGVLVLISFSGGLTSLISACIALVQDDIKKVIAYSTCSQLGYMVCICGLSGYTYSIFHLINHGFFKALLFLGAGSIISSMGGEQDIRKFGGLALFLPITYVCMILSFFALGGFPFLSGYYSKDLIIELQISKALVESSSRYFLVSSRIFFWFGLFTAFLTSCYSTKVLYSVFWGSFNGFKSTFQNISESKTISIALVILAIGGLFSGFYFETMFAFSNAFWDNSVYCLNINNLSFDMEFISWRWKTAALRWSIVGVWLGFKFERVLSIYHWQFIIILSKNKFYITSFSILFYFIYLNLNKWFFDIYYNYLVRILFLKASYNFFYKYIEKGFIFFISTGCFSSIISKQSKFLINKQLGYIYFLSLVFYFSFIIILFLSFYL